MIAPFEPFRIKAIEALRTTTRQEREKILAQAGYNLFAVDAENVLIDLLTDSGTAAMSTAQWSALMRADESYAGSISFRRFQSAIREIFGFGHVIPTHQGRAAERVLFSILCGAGQFVPSNTHFDITRANIEYLGAIPIDLPTAEARQFSLDAPFKGNMDLQGLAQLIERVGPRRIPFAMLTITNNVCGDQPVSMANIRAVKRILSGFQIPLYIDACRFAQNAYFIKMREPGHRHRSLEDIVREMFSHADGCTMSAKKDGLANTGGFIAMRDGTVARQARELAILTEGFPTHGGLASRDLETIAIGLRESLDETYQQYHAAFTAYVGEALTQKGIPIVQPPGGHAIYLDVSAFVPHLRSHENPGQALVTEIYLEAGIRSLRLSLPNGEASGGSVELVRLALPSRVYTQTHLNYVADAISNVYRRRHSIGGLTMIYNARFLGNFTAQFERAPAIVRGLTKATPCQLSVAGPQLAGRTKNVKVECHHET